MQRQDINTMIDRLDFVTVDHCHYEHDRAVIDSAITMLNDLGKLIYDLRLDNESLKQEILQLEAMIDD